MRASAHGGVKNGRGERLFYSAPVGTIEEERAHMPPYFVALPKEGPPCGSTVTVTRSGVSAQFDRTLPRTDPQMLLLVPPHTASRYGLWRSGYPSASIVKLPAGIAGYRPEPYCMGADCTAPDGGPERAWE